MKTPTPLMLDLDEMMEIYAWRYFQNGIIRNEKIDYKNLCRSDVQFDFDLTRLFLRHDEPRYENLTPIPPKSCTLFQSTFVNRTSQLQKYSFATERSTESICIIKRDQGYNIGKGTDLVLKTPREILEFQAGFRRELHVTQIFENPITATLIWNIGGDKVAVEPRSQITTKLQVNESLYEGDFAVVTHFSGLVTISMLRRLDRKLISTVTADIVEVFRDSVDNSCRASWSLVVRTLADVRDKSVEITTEGSCSFRFATEQRVSFEQRSVDD